MKNLVDLHTHILPGLDDGPQELTESLEMLEALQDMGFRHVFATPHHRLYSWVGIGVQTVNDGIRIVKRAAEERGIRVDLLPGMEFDLDETLPERVRSYKNKGGYLLVDVGFTGIHRDLAELLRRSMDGANILLVHPERNRKLCRNRRMIADIVSSGVRFLGNIGSLSGMYGSVVRRDARVLLKEGHYWGMASDMHSPDQWRWIRDGIDELVSLAGYSTARELLATRPMEAVRAMEENR